VKSVAKGKAIFAEGEPATGLWAILAGRVRLVRISPRGRELHTRQHERHSEAVALSLASVNLT